MQDLHRPLVDAIRLSVSDNVATVLRPSATGERIKVRCGSETAIVQMNEAIPHCHKVSVAALAADARVLKYGDPIGVAAVAISPGVHVHPNLGSLRARAAQG